MANSRAQNFVQSREKYNKSHETKQRDGPDQNKEKNELWRLVLITECSRERCGEAWAKETLLDAAKMIQDDLDSVSEEGYTNGLCI